MTNGCDTLSMKLSMRSLSLLPTPTFSPIATPLSVLPDFLPAMHKKKKATSIHSGSELDDDSGPETTSNQTATRKHKRKRKRYKTMLSPHKSSNLSEQAD